MFDDWAKRMCKVQKALMSSKHSTVTNLTGPTVGRSDDFMVGLSVLFLKEIKIE